MTARLATRRVLAPSDEGSAFHADANLTLLIEWADGNAAPTKFWLPNLSKHTSRKRLVRLAHIRWQVERDYEDLKQEVGLDHYGGREYVGWNHHVPARLAAFAFLLRERALGFSRAGRASKRSIQPRSRSDGEGVPLRRERHTPNFLATTRIAILTSAVHWLIRCPTPKLHFHGCDRQPGLHPFPIPRPPRGAGKAL
jgi:hypothetical protein